ncbi:MAG: hypothetical protein D6719_01450 [Candidatus Dadabacteria bacterium]|nr:MAG: hypothetical protein D6719_01450 [Candidatus Dadabacteria bacterium]
MGEIYNLSLWFMRVKFKFHHFSKQKKSAGFCQKASDKGAALVEYTLVITFIVLVAFTAARATGTKAATTLTSFTQDAFGTTKQFLPGNQSGSNAQIP